MATLNFLGGRLLFGTEYVGYTINIYEPGTTTPKTTYKDSALTVGNENTATITLDANGAAQVWYSGNAKWVFKDTSGSTIYTDDNVNLSASTSATGTGNLALNPSFESDTDADGLPDNWTRTLYSGGAFTLDTTDSYGGAQSAKFTSTGTGGGYLTSESTFPVSPSVAYTIGWAMKGTADVRNTVDILWYKKDGSASATASTTVYDNSTTNPTSWTEKWYEATSPSDAAFAAVRLTGCHSSDVTSGTTRFDQVFFTDFAHKRGINTLSRAINEAKGANVATAAVCDIWTPADGNTVHLTGTATTTSFGTSAQAGSSRRCIVDGTFVMVNGTNLVLPGTTNITCTANDKFRVFSDTLTKHYVFDYNRADGSPPVTLTGSSGASLVLLDTQTITTQASVSVTSKITSTYDDYIWIGENITIANDNDTMTFQGSKDNNSTNEASNYWIGSPNGAMSAAAVAIASLNNSSTLPMDFTMQLFNPLRTATAKTWLWKGSFPLTGTGVQNTFDKHCMWNETGAGKFFNAFKLSVGSTMSGTFKFYGIRKT